MIFSIGGEGPIETPSGKIKACIWHAVSVQYNDGDMAEASSFTVSIGKIESHKHRSQACAWHAQVTVWHKPR